MFEGEYTTIGQKWHLHPGVVKKSLNSHLGVSGYQSVKVCSHVVFVGAVMPGVYDEVVHAYQTLLPPPDGRSSSQDKEEDSNKTDWKPVRMADVFTQIISRASNRMMGGPALSRNHEWTATSINFTTDTWLAAQRLKRFPFFLRPIVQYFIPEMARIRAHAAIAQRVISPIVNARRSNEDQPLDLLQMLWDGAEPADKTPDFMAYTALAVSFAAIRTSSSVPTHLLFDLCAHPEYVEPLRREIEDLLHQEGEIFTKKALNKLVKLDSFMKESQRFNPLALRTSLPPNK